VVLLDSLGELASAYRLAAGAFIGGTLVPKGGHNPLEAARWGTPVVVGPSMENFREIAEHFDRAEAWERVPDAAGLARAWRRWLADPETARALGTRGRGLIETHRGALGRTLELLAALGGPPEPKVMPTTTAAGA
jgi:3-deoxy-D-manno-octulosonic-acid transferase